MTAADLVERAVPPGPASLRVLQVTNVGAAVGGAEKSVLILRDELRRRGHDVCVVSTDAQLGTGEFFADHVVPRRPSTPVRGMVAKIWYQSGYSGLRRLVEQYRPDVVHLHTVSEFGPGALWAVRDVPTVLTVHGPEEWSHDLLTWQLPSFVFRGGTYDWADITLPGKLRYRMLRHVQGPIYRSGFRNVDLFVAPSKYLADTLAADAGHVPVRQLYNGIDMPEPLPLPTGHGVLFVGRLESVKGVDTLLRAMVRVCAVIPDATLTVVGGGREEAGLRTLAGELRLGDAVRFAGRMPAAQVARHQAEARVLAVPSVWPENLPTVAIEALAVGRPVVASRVGGVSEVVDDGVTGVLVPPRNPVALADALIEVLADDRRAGDMGQAGAASARRFAVGPFIEAMEDLYRSVIADR